MRKLRHIITTLGQLIAVACLIGFPEKTIWAQQYQPVYYPSNQIQVPDVCSTRVPPLIISIQNDSDINLSIIAPVAFKTAITNGPGFPEAGEHEEAAPAAEAPQIENRDPLSERFCPQDIAAMEDQTLYAHDKYTFAIRRTGYPAHLYLKFRMAEQEPFGQYEVARWEYAEEGGSIDATCDLEDARLRFTIGCSGDNDITRPEMTINIGHLNRPVVPRPLIYGAEPDAGPPSTP